MTVFADIGGHKVTKSPITLDYPFNPVLALAEATFVAALDQTVTGRLKCRGAVPSIGKALVESCRIARSFNDGSFDAQCKEANIKVRHGEPIVFGANGILRSVRIRPRSATRPHVAIDETTALDAQVDDPAYALRAVPAVRSEPDHTVLGNPSAHQPADLRR